MSNQEFIERIVASEWYKSFKASQSKKEIKLLWKYIIHDCIMSIECSTSSTKDFCELFVEDNGVKFVLETAPYEEIAKIIKLFEQQ